MKNPLLTLLNGIPGSGKTTLGRYLASKLHMHFESLDDRKHRIAEVIMGREKRLEVLRAAKGYSKNIREEILKMSLAELEQETQDLEQVIFEVCLLSEGMWNLITTFSQKAGRQLFLVQTECSHEIAEKRLLARKGTNNPGVHPKDFSQIVADWIPGREPDFIFDTSSRITDQQVDRMLEALRTVITVSI